MKILIVEDEPMHADRFEMLVERLGYEVSGRCDNAFDALDRFYQTQPDLMLLDIHIRGEIDGIQLAERINEKAPVPVVFVTAQQDDETFARAQRMQPVAFILKPFDTLQLQRAIELAVSRIEHSSGHQQHFFEQADLVLPDCLFVKVREKLEKVLFEDILYLESDGRYSMLFTASGRKYAIRIPLGDLEAKLPHTRFARTHRSHLVHLKWLQSVDLQAMTVLIKDKNVPLSKGYRDQILARLDQI